MTWLIEDTILTPFVGIFLQSQFFQGQVELLYF
jgi:hypothetical protein